MPIGRSGSERPARERRSAVATASIASSWPTTRSCRRSSMCRSFSVSPSSRRLTGIPVQRATTSPTSSASTSSLRNTGPSSSVSRAAASRSASSFSSSGMSRYCSSAARSRFASRWARSTSMRACSRRSLISETPWMASFSRCHCSFIEADRAFSSSSSPSSASRRSLAASLLSLRREVSSISSCMMRRSTSSISVGRESISMRIFEAASSIRSMALSGRKRSAM